MPERIVVGGKTFNCPVQQKAPVGEYPSGREWKRIAVVATVDEVKESFVDGVSYTHEWDSRRYLTPEEKTEYDSSGKAYNEDENGIYIVETITSDLSEYCVAGEIVDTRDGNVTVYMGKKTVEEIYQETIDQLILEVLGVQ